MNPTDRWDDEDLERLDRRVERLEKRVDGLYQRPAQTGSALDFKTLVTLIFGASAPVAIVLLGVFIQRGGT